MKNPYLDLGHIDQCLGVQETHDDDHRGLSVHRSHHEEDVHLARTDRAAEGIATDGAVFVGLCL